LQREIIYKAETISQTKAMNSFNNPFLLQTPAKMGFSETFKPLSGTKQIIKK